jgi:hypothetical protein
MPGFFIHLLFGAQKFRYPGEGIKRSTHRHQATLHPGRVGKGYLQGIVTGFTLFAKEGWGAAHGQACLPGEVVEAVFFSAPKQGGRNLVLKPPIFGPRPQQVPAELAVPELFLQKKSPGDNGAKGLHRLGSGIPRSRESQERQECYAGDPAEPHHCLQRT